MRRGEAPAPTVDAPYAHVTAWAAGRSMCGMGWCHEFGSQIREGCGHPMTAGDASCACAVCGVSCPGRFSSCSAVWARGPREVAMASPVVVRRPAFVSRGEVSGAATIPAAVAGPEPAAAMEPAEDGRGEVLEWLQSAFDGVRDDLAMVLDAVGRQQQALTSLSEREGATTRLVELAEALPDRVAAAVADAIAAGAKAAEPRQPLPEYIDQAVREIVRPGQGAMMNRVDEVAAELRGSLAEVQAAAGELRNEMARLAAFRSALAADQPELAHVVEAATQRADGRLTTLAQRMESIGERPEWKSVRARLSFRRD